MDETNPRGTLSGTEKVYHELSKMKSEGLFCRRCSCYCATKSEFNQHVIEHIKQEDNGDTENFMNYIANYICSKCGQQFEVKSDLIIHYNTVCTDANYVCKHCREDCNNSPFLKMHLVLRHNYSKELLHDEGFLTDLNDYPSFSRFSFATGSKQTPFKSPPPELKKNFDMIGGKMIVKYTYSRKYGFTRKHAISFPNLAFNLLDKEHTCQMCKKSFSRKCALENHVQQHTSIKTREKKESRDISEKCLAINAAENSNCYLNGNSTQNSGKIYIPEAKVALSKIQTPILKPSNVVFRSSVWKKVEPKGKLPGIKNYASTRISNRRKKKTENSKGTTQNTSKTDVTSQLPKETATPAAWKKIKLRSETRNTVVSDGRKDLENLNKKKKVKYSEMEKCKETPKQEGKQAFMCEVCKKTFKDGYKLKRHFLIHTGVRAYTCTKCKKTFSRDDHLKRHIKRVCSKIANS